MSLVGTTPKSVPSYFSQLINAFIKSILKSLVILAMWLSLGGAIYSQIALFFALNCIFFSANENKTVKQNNQSHDAITSRWHDADMFSKSDVNEFCFLFLTNRLLNILNFKHFFNIRQVSICGVQNYEFPNLEFSMLGKQNLEFSI